jgi:hypothetical protein
MLKYLLMDREQCKPKRREIKCPLNEYIGEVTIYMNEEVHVAKFFLEISTG